MRPFLATRDKSNTYKPAQIKPRFVKLISNNALKGTTVFTFFLYDCFFFISKPGIIKKKDEGLFFNKT